MRTYQAVWLAPLGMALMNFLSLLMGLLFERRLKLGALKFMCLYAASIPSAARGDLEPFIIALGSPPS